MLPCQIPEFCSPDVSFQLQSSVTLQPPSMPSADNCSFPFMLFNCLATRLSLSQIRRSNIEMFVITGLLFCQRGTIIQRRAAGREPDVCRERKGKNRRVERKFCQFLSTMCLSHHHLSELSGPGSVHHICVSSSPSSCYLSFLFRNFHHGEKAPEY